MKKLSSFLIARRQFLSTHNKQALQQYDATHLPVRIYQHHDIIHRILRLTASVQKFIEYEKKEIQRTLDLPQSNTDPIGLILQTLDTFSGVEITKQTLKELHFRDENEDEESFESLRATVRIRKMTETPSILPRPSASLSDSGSSRALGSSPSLASSLANRKDVNGAPLRNPEPWEVNIVAVERGLWKLPVAAEPPRVRESAALLAALGREAFIFRLPHLQPRPKPPEPEWQLMPTLPPGTANFGRGNSQRIVPAAAKGSVPLSTSGSAPTGLGTPPSSPPTDSLLRARTAPMAIEKNTLTTSADSGGSDGDKKGKKTSSRRDKKEEKKDKSSPAKDKKKDLKDSKKEKSSDKTEKHVHRFVRYHFQGPRKCAICEELVWGAGKQGYYCRLCDSGVHGTCLRAVE